MSYGADTPNFVGADRYVLPHVYDGRSGSLADTNGQLKTNSKPEFPIWNSESNMVLPVFS
jgi:hypothetical protein